MAFLPLACQQSPPPPEPAVYHWRSGFNPGPYETAFLRDHRVRKVYLRFFDVDLDPATGKPAPVAPLRAGSLEGYDVIPVVFITQQALRAMPDSAAGMYAKLICARIRTMAQQFRMRPIKEWQVDCDWTAATRERYFALLKKVKEEDEKIQLSVTLRLYPFKYRHEMGVPPADRAMLMCYNMGNLKRSATANSIIDTDEMEKYLNVNQHYPLPLDAALPLFEWYVWFRGMEYIGIAYPSEIKGLPLREQDGKLFFTQDTVAHGRLFRKGDWLRHEAVSQEALLKARTLIDEELAGQRPGRIALFHLDSITLSKYPSNALEQVLRGSH